ncbi:mucin-22-like isoform X2 [Haliotis cracherodii]|uniref:mucin-22-like isoform X2 n=1 Tax=Haliotis cracherodii TaxID=6455 RepID=UPI0039EA3A06
MPDPRLLFSIPLALAVMSPHSAWGCPAFTMCQTRMESVLGAHGADTPGLCRGLRDYLACARGASASCGVAERGYVVEAFNLANMRYSTLCSALYTTSVPATVDSTTGNSIPDSEDTAAPSTETSTVSSATTLTSVGMEKTTPEADLFTQYRRDTLPPVTSLLPKVTGELVTTSVTSTSATTDPTSTAAAESGSACISPPGGDEKLAFQLCTVTPVISQFITGCPQLDDCVKIVSSSFSSSDHVFICRSLVSYRTCAQNARRVCVGNIDDSGVEQSVLDIYKQSNCTAVLKEITTSVEMSPVTARISESAPTRGIPETDGTSQLETSPSATAATPYIQSTNRFELTDTQTTDVTSTRLKGTSVPTMSSARNNRFELTDTQTTDVSSTRLKGTSVPTMSSARNNRFELTDTQTTDVTSTRLKGTSVPTMSSARNNRFELTDTQTTDVTSTRSKGTSVPTMSSARINRTEMTDTQITDVTSTRSKGTSVPTMSSARINRTEMTDTQTTDVTSTRLKGTSVPPVSSTDRQTLVPSSTASRRKIVTNANHVTWSTTKYMSTVVRRHPSSTPRVTELPISSTDDVTVPTSKLTSQITSTKYKSLVANTRTSRVTPLSILPGLSTEGSPGFHQSRKTSTQSTDHTGYGTRSSTEMKKSSSQIPGTFPTTPPAEEEDSTRDASNPQGEESPSSGTDSSMAVSTLSAVAVIWVGCTLHVTIT